jgi:hypothetical protein
MGLRTKPGMIAIVTLVTEMLELHKHLSHEKDRSGEAARHAGD